MAHGLPDDSNIVKPGPTVTMTDQAELAVRLGSIVTFDRLGTVVDLETFLHGCSRWELDSWGVGGGVTLSNYRSIFDGVSLKLTSGTGGIPNAIAVWNLAYPVLSRLGYEACYALGEDRHELRHGIFLYHDGIQTYFILNWDLTTGIITYMDITGFWLPTGIVMVPVPGDYLFQRVKLVVNGVNNEYERLIVNDEHYDLTTRYCPTMGAGPGNFAVCWTEVEGDGITSTDVYLDGCIFTQTETAEP